MAPTDAAENGKRNAERTLQSAGDAADEVSERITDRLADAGYAVIGGGAVAVQTTVTATRRLVELPGEVAHAVVELPDRVSHGFDDLARRGRQVTDRVSRRADVEIRWPDGSRQLLRAVEADQFLVVDQAH